MKLFLLSTLDVWTLPACIVVFNGLSGFPVGSNAPESLVDYNNESRIDQ